MIKIRDNNEKFLFHFYSYVKTKKKERKKKEVRYVFYLSHAGRRFEGYGGFEADGEQLISNCCLFFF